MYYTKRFNPDSISDKQLLEELRNLANKLGRTPSQNDIKKFGNGIVKRIYLYRRRFGSLQAAQEKAGCAKNLGGVDLKYTDEELLNEIIRVENLLGHTPTQDEIHEKGKYSPGAYKRHFGTYNEALKRLGIRHNVKFNQTVEEIKQDIIRVSKIFGRAPTSNEFEEYSQTVSWVTAINKIDGYGSWNNTLKSCGLETTYNKNVTEQEFKNEISRLQNLLGRIPGYYDMIQFGKYTPESYANHYGSYVEALRYFGFDYVPQNRWHNACSEKGLDGIIYKSKFEVMIAGILLTLKSDKIIASYEYEKKICPSRQWTCDFVIHIDTQNGIIDLWLEADGMGKNRPEVYSEEHEKIKYYIEHDFNFYIINYNRNKVKEELIRVIGRYTNEK